MDELNTTGRIVLNALCYTKDHFGYNALPTQDQRITC
jgi:hypothetical protein